MFETINERVDFLVRNCANGNNLEFSRMVGTNEGNIRNYRSKTVPKQDFLEKCVKILRVSSDWILTGAGEPFIDSKELSTSTTHCEELPRFASASEAMQSQIGGSKLIPYYDVDFMGGFAEVENDQTINPDDWVVSPGFERATLWCRCSGRSMEPLINSGDLIALRQCRASDIQYGNVYAVVLDTIRTVKVLRRSATPDQTLLFVPVNREEFDEQEFPLSRILQIYEVIGCTHYIGQ